MEETVTNRIDGEIETCKEEIRLLKSVREKFKEVTYFYVEISLPHSRSSEVIAIARDIRTAINKARLKVKNGSNLHWDNYIVGYLIPVSPEELAYVGGIGTSGRTLISGSGLSAKAFANNFDFTPEEMKIMESSIFISIQENLWKHLTKKV